MKASLNYQALKNGQPVSDALVVEVPVQLFIEEEPLTVSMCTPTHIREWAYGILFTEGIIRSTDQVLSYSEEEVDHQITNVVQTICREPKLSKSESLDARKQ
jgi:formate dehydrogenase accessory protein FdhD